jgi:ABC-type multidrug transport system fused ATPase/permease subunit
MLNLDSGSITIDNINLTQLSHDFVSSKLIALPQEVYILEGSVRLNIDPTKEIPDANIVLVLEKVQLWEKINARGGLDAIVDDKFFSTGEAQLLVFARAMLRKSKVLILDEFTSR